MLSLKPLGERAWLVQFADPDAASRWAIAARRAEVPGLVDVVVADVFVSVHLNFEVEPEPVEEAIRAVEALEFDPEGKSSGRLIPIPVLYDGADLAEVADRLELGVDRLIQIHSESTYRVLAVGFQPGFPYAGPLPPPLDRVPRRPEPRPRVPAGSVAIAAGRTGIYPAELPGGWNLLGRTPLATVDLARGHFPIRAGDTLAFRPIDRGEFESLVGEVLQ